MRYGVSLGWDTDTKVERSLGDVEFFDCHAARRTARFSIDYLPEDEVMACRSKCSANWVSMDKSISSTTLTTSSIKSDEDGWPGWNVESGQFQSFQTGNASFQLTEII